MAFNEEHHAEIDTLMKLGGPLDQRIAKFIERETKLIEKQQGSDSGSKLAMKTKQYSIVEEITEIDENDSVSLSSCKNLSNSVSELSFRIKDEQDEKLLME